ncbi:hypothetical protein EK21DRAFT_113193 [Setomelanomma holmii]|uniref:Nuclear distribution protein n=1 Tax=Setomelanomma holmii TaxID=210430 RepID=A0A9P4LKV3_9PLEO|nr:hypothetical protein EK21DRAFT_113193 [Setomelanomma holmii]
MDEYEEAILFTFGALESRLDRLEYILTGPHAPVEEKPKTILDRIHRIERLLPELSEKTSLLADVDELLSKHKDVLTPPDDYDRDQPSLDTAQKELLVVERATGFATTASQLKALEDQQIPTSDGFAKLATLRPRISEVEDRHLRQALKISELRRRNGLVNKCYKQIHFIGAGRVWLDYHVRLTKALTVVEREEFRRRPDEEAVVEPQQEEEEDDDDEL